MASDCSYFCCCCFLQFFPLFLYIFPSFLCYIVLYLVFLFYSISVLFFVVFFLLSFPLFKIFHGFVLICIVFFLVSSGHPCKSAHIQEINNFFICMYIFCWSIIRLFTLFRGRIKKKVNRRADTAKTHCPTLKYLVIFFSTTIEEEKKYIYIFHSTQPGRYSDGPPNRQNLYSAPLELEEVSLCSPTLASHSYSCSFCTFSCSCSFFSLRCSTWRRYCTRSPSFSRQISGPRGPMLWKLLNIVYSSN